MESLMLASQLFSLCWTLLTCCICIISDLPSTLFRLAFGKRLPSQGVVFFEGMVTHVRRKPLRNSFRYPIRCALISLDAAPSWFREQSQSYMTADEARSFAGTAGPVKLLTNPAAAGYDQNPISVYYCYGEDGATLDKCISEVTNTPWNDKVRFIFRPSGEHVPKSLHVSPFMDMKASWLLSSSTPDETLRLSVLVKDHPDYGNFFDAHLVAKRVNGPCASLRNEEAGFMTLLRFGYMPQRIAVLIYWQALKLLWKGARFFSPPAKDFRSRFKHPGATTHPLSSQGCPFEWIDVQKYPWRTD